MDVQLGASALLFARIREACDAVVVDGRLGDNGAGRPRALSGCSIHTVPPQPQGQSSDSSERVFHVAWPRILRPTTPQVQAQSVLTREPRLFGGVHHICDIATDATAIRVDTGSADLQVLLQRCAVVCSQSSEAARLPTIMRLI